MAFTATVTTLKDTGARSALCAKFDELEGRIETAFEEAEAGEVGTAAVLTASKIIVGAGTNQVGVSAKTIAELMTDAGAYTPATAAQWADPDPTTIAQAIDRLAAAVYALQTSTPIA